MKNLLRDDPMIVIALCCAIFIGIFWFQSINERKIETENQTLVDKVNNTTFVNTDNANELYQFTIVDGLADVRRNTKHYTTPYQTISDDTISFKSPQDEPVTAQFISIDSNSNTNNNILSQPKHSTIDFKMLLTIGENESITLTTQ